MKIPLSYDGHGLNDKDGRRLITWQRQSMNEGGGYVLPQEDRDRLGPVLAQAPAMLSELRALVEYEADAFENDTEINGGDLVEWFSARRARLLRLIKKAEGA